MHSSLASLCEALDQVAKAVLGVQSDNRRVPDLIGTWHVATLNREQLADIPADLAARLRTDDVDEIPSTSLKKIDALSESVKALQTQIVAQMFGGNAIYAVDAYLGTFHYVEFVLDAQFGWRSLPSRSSMPATMIRRIRGLEGQLTTLEVNTERVQGQLKTINDAYEAAENLPATSSELERLTKEVGAKVEQSDGLLKDAQQESEKAIKGFASLKLMNDEAAKIVARCQDAYRIATTTGLAGAFDARASALSSSMWIWVGGLFAALLTGGLVGYFRIAALTQLLEKPVARPSDLLLQTLLSLVSVGAPIWFAWLSTKQIGQRFRLSEDYAFKATLAKAYEGYRREAERIDKSFEKRLFSSALDRLEEPPLRLVEIDSHGSPLHEFRSGRSWFGPRRAHMAHDTPKKAAIDTAKPSETT